MRWLFFFPSSSSTRLLGYAVYFCAYISSSVHEREKTSRVIRRRIARLSHHVYNNREMCNRLVVVRVVHCESLKKLRCCCCSCVCMRENIFLLSTVHIFSWSSTITISAAEKKCSCIQNGSTRCRCSSSREYVIVIYIQTERLLAKTLRMSCVVLLLMLMLLLSSSLLLYRWYDELYKCRCSLISWIL